MTMTKEKRDIVAYLKKRRDKLVAWLKREGPTCFSRQKHLTEGSEERVYWHYGYLTAVRDTLRLLSRKEREKAPELVYRASK
jgi:hypothetical protein